MYLGFVCPYLLISELCVVSVVKALAWSFTDAACDQ